MVNLLTRNINKHIVIYLEYLLKGKKLKPRKSGPINCQISVVTNLALALSQTQHMRFFFSVTARIKMSSSIMSASQIPICSSGFYWIQTSCTSLESTDSFLPKMLPISDPGGPSVTCRECQALWLLPHLD